MTARNRGARRRTNWIDQTVIQTVVAGGTTQEIDLLSDASPSELEGLTVVRTLIDLTVTPAAAPGAFVIQLPMIAGAIINDEADAAGALPDLLNDTDYPNRGYVFKMTAGVVGANPTEEEFGHVARFTADIRAMRKLETSTRYLLLLANLNVTGTAITVQFAGLIRTLVKLP